MNITLIYLSLSNVYMNSPMFVGNNLIFRKGKFSHSISTILFNPKYFNLNACQFSNIQGSIINMNENSSSFPFKYVMLNRETIENDGKIEIKNEIINSNISYLVGSNLVIHDCIFSDISYHYTDTENSNIKSPIDISGQKPFYMTNCIFKNIKGQKAPLHFAIKSATIDHVCMYNCASSKDIKYMQIDNTKESFCKIIYSTFAEEDGQKEENGAFEFKHGYFQLNCLNFSNILSNQFTIKTEDPMCIIFSMNTFAKLNSVDIFQMPISGNSFVYFSRNNIINNEYSDSLFLYNQNDLQNNNTYFKDCYLKSNLHTTSHEYKNYFKFNGNSIKIKVFFDHCYLDNNPESSGDNIINITNTNTDTDIVPNIHFATDVCKGTSPDNIYACMQNKCPENDYDNKCDKNKFDFQPGDVTYTLIPHTDIKTPTKAPTQEFTHSSFFTNSSPYTSSDYFSSTSKFTKSKYFTETNKFTKSTVFSSSSKFTKSSEFSKSDVFTNTHSFTCSTAFSGSNKFTKSNVFSQSYSFITPSRTKTNEFTKSFYFSHSNIFSQSEMFSDVGDNQSNGGKISTGALAGIIAGIVAAVALIAALAAFFIIKKRKGLKLTSDQNIMETNDSMISVSNNLQDIMENDDPFAQEFN